MDQEEEGYSAEFQRVLFLLAFSATVTSMSSRGSLNPRFSDESLEPK